jgi:gas vesicle protein
MKEKRFGYEEFGLGLLLGVLTGAVLALIFAPQSGQTTRRQIASKAGDLKDSAEELIEHGRKSLEEAGSKVEGVFGLREKSIRRKIEELRAELQKLNLEGSKG